MNDLPFEKSEKGILSGELGLSPIQTWFFEQNFANQNYVNQAEVFESNNYISLPILRSVFKVISQYHDVFRIKYTIADDKCIQEYLDHGNIDVEEKTLHSDNENSLRDELSKDAESIQSSLDLVNGPLIRVVLYRCFDKKDRIFICVHHMVIDGISWRILLDDIETLYDLFSNNKKIILPAKTYSYRQWVSMLVNYSQSEAIKNEVNYWNNVVRGIVEVFSSETKPALSGSDIFSISLSEKETDNLLREIPKKYDSHINDILLTALVIAVGDLTSEYECSITLEGHGREEVIGLDVSRTIGWFTSMFPVNLKITDPKNLFRSVAEIQNILRKIPNNGVSYGIINYYVSKFEKPLPKIGFNYLGQFNTSTLTQSFLSYSDYSPGKCEDAQNIEYNSLEINAWVRQSKLEVMFGYRLSHCSSDRIIEFSQLFKRALFDLIVGTKSD